jgi:uncharacterized damage-inducible protein DinB
MNVQDILTLYDYNYWATRRILTAGAQVSRDQFVAPSAHSHGGLRGTLVHALDAEYGWRMLCQHYTTTPDMAEATFPTLQALEQRWREEEQAMRAYLGSLTDVELAGHVRYTTGSGQVHERVLWHCLLHIVNHGTQHRSEAAAILTGYGHSPGDLDFMLFLSEQT